MTGLDFDQPYPTHRSPVLARNIVATSQPLAAQAGLRMLLAGGNAVDAAVATAIALTVLEPTSNGIGSDAFAIVWDGAKLHGLNASGRSPAAWVPELFTGTDMPIRGWGSVTVPGAVSAWVQLSKRFGKLSFERLFEPAIDYAANGFAVSPIIARSWQRALNSYREFEPFQKTFAPRGRAPAAGECVVLPDHARTLRRIAETEGSDFYHGDLARRIVAHASETGGLMTLDDLQSHRADWVEPISVDYAGLAVHEIPPNGQGIAALIALGILAQFPLREMPPDSPQALHLQIEAMKLALADVHAHVADPQHMKVTAASLFDPDYARNRATLIDPNRAAAPVAGAPKQGGTVYLTAADASGMMVSMIQSNYYGFGSGIVIPGTGIAMQNRGYGFTTASGHPNQVGPRKRPFHTIIPALVTRDSQPVMSFGVMGGPMQPQGHVQMITRIFDHGQNPQAACDAPRWRVDGPKLLLESTTAPETIESLRKMGHQVTVADAGEFGGAQIAMRLGNGYLGASDGRKDGQVAGY